jgi:hypothetical protein
MEIQGELIELRELRKLYGAKFNAISSALEYATEASDHFTNGDEYEGIQSLNKVIEILMDA